MLTNQVAGKNVKKIKPSVIKFTLSDKKFLKVFKLQTDILEVTMTLEIKMFFFLKLINLKPDDILYFMILTVYRKIERKNVLKIYLPTKPKNKNVELGQHKKCMT